MGSWENMNRHVCQIMETSWQAMMLFVPDEFRIVYANSAARSIFGEQIMDCECFIGIELKETPCLDCPFMNLKIGEECVTQRYYSSYDMMVRVKANAMDWGGGKRVVLCTIIDTANLVEAAKNINIEKDTEEYKEKLRLYGELYHTVVSQLKTIVFEYNCLEDTIYVSPLFGERFGVDCIEDVNFSRFEKTRELVYEEDLPLYQTLFDDYDSDSRELTCRMREKTGAIGWYHICIQNIRDEKGNITRVIGTLKDVDREVKSSEMIRHQSEFDGLTELYNANHFYRVASHILEMNDSTYAIVAFDIDRFRMINDLFGMITGDAVLRHIASVLNEKLPAGSISCRMHSDIFVACIPYNRKGDVIKCVEKIRKGIYKNDFSFDVNTSYGIYLVENREVPINLMCDRATLAARTVKNNAIKFCAFYDEQYRNEMIKATEIEQDMNTAIKDKQFVMYLQPKVSLETGKLCGAEVLARWMHPVKGLIQPNDFIPLFEKNGFILRLDEYMWEEACKAISRWKKKGIPLIPLSVNISRYHIRNNDLIGVWKRLLRKYDIDPKNISLEITETFFYDSSDLQNVMAKLQDMGFRLEMDDFGSGYSSLNMIRRVPVDTIKIDKDFLDQELSSERGKVVITHTIAMAKDLRLSVVAEGVETQEHVDFLKNACCDIAQGYYFAKPMPLEEFEQMFFS